MEIHCYITFPSLWQTGYSECRTVLHLWCHRLTKTETHNTSFVPAALASLYNILFHTLKVTVSNIYTTEIDLIWVLFTFDGIEEPFSIVRRNLSEHQLPGCGINHMKLAANKEIFCKVLKTHLIKLAYL